MPAQLIFDLPTKPALGRDDFFVSAANELAVSLVGDWANWPSGKMLLVGPAGSGKTHLVHVWASEADADILQASQLANTDIAACVKQNARIAVEDVDAIAEDAAGQDALFHLHNLVLAEGGRLLMSATTPPGIWQFTLPDLASRVQSASLAALQPADDMLLTAVLLKLFADRQIVVKPDVISYLVARMDRSFDAARNLVTALDAAALAEKRAVTKALAMRVFEAQENN
ncbi:MAG: chromosomal replication initiator DnaA [Marinosulfonomonas sp.]